MHCLQGSESPLVVTHKRRQPRVKVHSKSYPGISIEHDANQSECAVYIRNLRKTYEGGGPPVLEQLCMSVRKKTIYGLLGASGCGKTTILSCIVGLSKWDSGNLLVFGKIPGSKGSEIPGKKLGYMPQDIALYSQLTIMENIQFYRRIYNIVEKDVGERWRFLNKLLELPDNNKLVEVLSGGQKRRVSLALALIHSPELLILDEPTVGLDPLLRQKIWNHLYKLVSTLGTTIIITTHYIEEARLSNTIGVLRKGRLIVENTPINILQRFQCHLLEHAVLQLCREDDNARRYEDKNAGQNTHNIVFKSSWSDYIASSIVATNDHYDMLYGIFRQSSGFDCEISQHLGPKDEVERQPDTFSDKLKHTEIFGTLARIYGLMAVILQNCSRYPLLLVAILLLPTVQAALTAWLLGTKPIDLNFGIVNHELRNWTEECNLPIHSTNSCYLQGLSCRIIKEIEKSDNLLTLTSFETEKDALAEAHLGRLWGYLTFPENYTQNALDVAVAKNFALNESIVGSQIPVHLDHSQYIAAFFMIQHLLNSYLAYGKMLAVFCGNVSEHVDTSPLHFREPIYGGNDSNYMAFMMPGVILSSVTCFAAVLTAVILITDRKQGTLDRARVAGINYFEVITSHLITQGALNIAQTIILGLILHFGFHYVIKGSLWLCVAINLFTAICSSASGLFLGIVCRDEVEPIILGTFFIPVTLLYGGAIWPVESMAKIWRMVARILPTSFPTDALRSVTIRGLGLSHGLVWPGFVELAVWTVVFCLLCTVFAKFKRFA